MSDRFGNHIVGFPTRRLKLHRSTCSFELYDNVREYINKRASRKRSCNIWWTGKSHRKKSRKKVTEKSHGKKSQEIKPQEKSHKKDQEKMKIYNLYINIVGHNFHIKSKQ